SIDEHGILDRHPTVLGADQTGDDVDERRLPGARPAEECDEPASRLKACLEQERAQPVPDVDDKRHSTSSRRLTIRAMSSEASSASRAIATDTRVSRSAPASPPGTWMRV